MQRTEETRPWVIRATLVAMTCISSVAMSAAAAGAQEPPGSQAQPLVIVMGQGIVRAAPDRAIVVIAAEARAKNPADAQRQNAVVMTAVQDRLKQAGLPSGSVRTIGYDLQAEFDYNNGRQTLKGYVARNTIEVTLDRIDRVGEIIDLAVSAGATSVQGVRFDLKSRDATEREALRLAVADARSRADAAASGAGLRIDRVWRIEESRTFMPPPMPLMMMREAMGGTAAPPTPVTAGEIEVRAQVTLSAVVR